MNNDQVLLPRFSLPSSISRSYRLKRSALLEFLLHGIRYAFPAERGAMTRGVPARYAASPLKQHLEQGKEPPPVWPYVEGSVRGYSYAPLHKNVPRAALSDPYLYELLVLVDALRDGRAREREIAVHERTTRLDDVSFVVHPKSETE